VDPKELELLRVPEERELSQSLSAILNIPLLREIARKIPPKQWEKEFYYDLKAHSIQATNGLIQPLEEIFTEVRAKLGLSDRQIDLYVSSDHPLNCRYYGGNSDFFPDIFCIGSELVERLNKAGLAFVIGHELGHLIFEHVEFQEAMSLLYSSRDKLPLSIKNQHNLLRKLEEISADRVGLLASGDLEASIKAMIMISSGLNDNLLTLTLDQVINYSHMILEDLKKMKIYPETSHPAMPLRIAALKVFADSDLYRSIQVGKPVNEDPDLESQMAGLTSLIKAYPANTQEYWTMMAKASAICMIISADNNITQEERIGLLDIISGFCWCPDSVLKNILQKGPQTFLEVAVNYLRMNNPSKIEEIVGESARFIVRDRRIDTPEYEKYMELARNYLGMEEDKALLALVAAVNVLNKI